MSNILIIKHGSLGDIVQISGILRDIRESHKANKIFFLTTNPYIELMSNCPYVDAVLLDRRSPRWNFFYLIKLRKLLNKFMFSHVFDLQNSSRTRFYRKYLINALIWSSTDTILKKNEKKKNFDKESVLNRFKIQLSRSNIKTDYSLKPDFSWAAINIKKIINKYFVGSYILIFPFCSPQLSHKKWPYYNKLIEIIKSKHENLKIIIAPGPNEINEAKKIDAITIINNNKSLNIMELAGLIRNSSYVIANDTGPAHITAHLGKKGTVIFGRHTTAKKVSIETNDFKAISVEKLNKLTAEEVYLKVKDDLNLIK